MKVKFEEQVEYWQTSFETKLNLSDAFISELCVKYCESKMKAGEVKKAVEFSKRIYQVQEVFNSFRSIFNKAKVDNLNLFNENKTLKQKLNEYEKDDSIITQTTKAEFEQKFRAELEGEYREKFLADKDKLYSRIQELEIENDQLLKQLIRKNQ